MANPPHDCSACGKSQDVVRAIIAGPGKFICNECVALCNEALAGYEPAEEETPRNKQKDCWFCSQGVPPPLNTTGIQLCAGCIELCNEIVEDTKQGKKTFAAGDDGDSGGTCSFCSTRELPPSKLVLGPGVSMCDQCIALCTQYITTGEKLAAKEDSSKCAFCGKRASDVDKLIDGPSICICNECVEVVRQVFAERGTEQNAEQNA